MAAPNGNNTALTYDALGRALTKVTTGTGGVSRASYTWTRNKAGQTLSEASTITGDPTNGTTTYTDDPLERLSGFTRSGTTTAYGWQAEPNRASVQVGANPAVTTSYDDADRPTSDSAGGTYTSDLDGRLTLLAGKTLVWDSLGRLTQVKTGATPIATYSYDPLDRLRLADYGGGVRTRLRYVGQTTAIAQLVDDAAGTVSRHMGTDWSGERLVDWTDTGQNQRFTGTNGHHDLTWTASDTGAITATLRYDPWGTLTSSTGSSSNWPDLRFQSSWYDTATDLSWVISRWYAPSLGRFVSEDSLLGEPADPPSRHLYAYGQGEPISRWDPDGRWWYRVRPGDTLRSLADRYLRGVSDWAWIFQRNRQRIIDPDRIVAGWCLWIPAVARHHPSNQCIDGQAPTGTRPGYETLAAARRLGVDWRTLTLGKLLRLTDRVVRRSREPSGFTSWLYSVNRMELNVIAFDFIGIAHGHKVGSVAGVPYFAGNDIFPWGGATATTIGGIVFVRSKEVLTNDPVTAHEYIHVLQGEVRGFEFWTRYLSTAVFHEGKPSNWYESIGYLWQGYIEQYGNKRLGSAYGDNQPWCFYKPLKRNWTYCP